MRARILAWTPALAMILLEYSNVAQLWRMWTDQTAAGQELTGWVAVTSALLLWAHFYRHQRDIAAVEATRRAMNLAYWMALLGVFMNGIVALTVAYFRYLA